jgi:hypothetical protein
MKTNIKLMNCASYLNMAGNILIGFGGLTLTFASINYVHNFDNILKESKKELVNNYSIFSEEEFRDIEERSRIKARQDLMTLIFGMVHRERFVNKKWSERARSDLYNIYTDIIKYISNNK